MVQCPALLQIPFTLCEGPGVPSTHSTLDAMDRTPPSCFLGTFISNVGKCGTTCTENQDLLWVCRSEKGAVHIWDLNSRRPVKVVEAHSGSSVIWVSMLQSTGSLLRWVCFMVLVHWVQQHYNHRQLCVPAGSLNSVTNNTSQTLSPDIFMCIHSVVFKSVCWTTYLQCWCCNRPQVQLRPRK